MHRIDGPGATAQNQFTEGDPQQGVPPTTVTDAWANDVQEELCTLVETAGLTLTKGQQNQVLNGLKALLQERAEKGVANGYAGLDGAGAVPLAQIPVIPYTKLSGGDGSYTEAVAAATFTADFLINRRFMVDQIYGSLNAGFVAIAQGVNSAFPAGEQLVTGWTTPRMKLYNENSVQTVGISWRYLT